MLTNYIKNILLVDDDTEDQEFFIEALTGIENLHLFGVANNGREALTMLENPDSFPDYIFLDFNMPVMNGVDCLMSIKKLSTIKHIPVFMLSSAIEQAELSRKLGAKGFIKKSSDLIAFRAELNHIINFGVSVNYLLTDTVNALTSLQKTSHEKTSKNSRCK